MAESDADRLIVSTAIDKTRAALNVVVVGQNIDLFVLLTSKGLSKSDKASKHSNETLFNISRQKAVKIFLFAHAASECDTTFFVK